MNQKQLGNVVQLMQTDIMANGPITAIIRVFDDLLRWTPEKGMYKIKWGKFVLRVAVFTFESF